MLGASYDEQGDHAMNAQLDFDVHKARLAHIGEGDNRERLADIARAGRTNSSLTAGIFTLFRRIIQHSKTPQEHSFAVSDISQPTASGAGHLV